MVMLFGLVVAATTLSHRILGACAPSNRLIRRLGHMRPATAAAGTMVVLGIAMVALAHAIQVTMAGHGGSLYAAVLVLAWDGLKLTVAGLVAGVKSVALGAWRLLHRGSELWRIGSNAESTPAVEQGGVQVHPAGTG